MSSFRTNYPASSCCYIPRRHRGFYKHQLCQLDVYDEVMKEMKCHCHDDEDEEQHLPSHYDTRPFSIADSSFHCCPCVLEREGYKYFHGHASSSPPTLNPSDYDIHWPDDEHLPLKWRMMRREENASRRRQSENYQEEEENKQNKPNTKTHHYTVFH